MKRNRFLHIATAVFSALSSLSATAQQYIAQPYYSENKVRFYTKDAPIAAAPYYTLDVSADIVSVWGHGTSGVNAVAIYKNKIFVSCNLNDTGGVLIYNYADVYPTRTGVAPIAISPQNPAGLSTTGITINPANGDLYIATIYDGSSDAGVYMSTAASGYTTTTQFASYEDDNSVATVCADLAFDGGGNLWMTTWDMSDAANAHFLICYKGGVKANYYKITNDATTAYTATDVTGATATVNLLSAPEGLAIDAAGNVWVGNNNDDFLTNAPGQGTLVKISASYVNTMLAGISSGAPGGSSFLVPPASVTIDLVPSGKLGGMMFDADTLYINDQGQDQGSDYTTNGTVWKYNTTGVFTTTYFTASGIHTTYPGNGQMALNNTLFPLTSSSAVNTVTTNNTALQIMPNPVTDNFSFIINANNNTSYTVKIIDAAGKVIYTSATAANTQVKVNMNTIAAGIYTLTAIPANGGQVLTQKIEKQ